MVDGRLGVDGALVKLAALDQLLMLVAPSREPELAPSPNPRMEADNALVAVLKRAPAGSPVHLVSHI